MGNERSPQPKQLSASDVTLHAITQFAMLCGGVGVAEDAAVEQFRDGLRAGRRMSEGGNTAVGDPFVASQTISEWHENVRFLTPAGAPADLSVAKGEFDALCAAAGVKDDSHTLLESLVRNGAVRKNGDFVSVSRREVIVGEDDPAGISRAVRLVGNLAGTCNHNLASGARGPGRFERSVSSNRLPRRHLPALLAYLAAHGASFLEDLDAWMVAREDDRESGTIGVGVYLFAEDA